MSFSQKVKSVLTLSGKDHAGLAAHLGISSQALSNKFYRDSFSAADLVRVGEYCGATLAFLTSDGNKIALDVSDATKEVSK
jgi:hypothetical protein